MAGYLDQYGAGEERRNRIIIRSILAVLGTAFVVTLGWYLLLNHHQEGVVKEFVAALKRGDTQGAYRGWGCLVNFSGPGANPCPDYTYERFLKDWGPGPDGPDPARVPVGHLGQPADIAGMALAMLTNPYLTSKVITVDGGIYPA